MDLFTVIIVGDEQSPVRRFQVPKIKAQRGVILAGVAVLLVAGAVWDYWRVRAENAELPDLRATTHAQASEIRRFQRALEHVESELTRVQELERKVRIIANLPGATASGGDPTEIAPAVDGDEVGLPTGVPGDLGQGGLEPGETPFDDREKTLEEILDFERMRMRADHLEGTAEYRADSLGTLVGQLEVKSNHLASLPSIWPVRGWLTSRFGPRISPFTGRRHMHSGIDIATKHGTPIHAPARGRVTFVGRKGPLGKSVVLDHGFGVRTFYGHNSEIHVKSGEQVERGQLIADVGSTGRSTGPHLHYTIEVNGKAVDPLDYILD